MKKFLFLLPSDLIGGAEYNMLKTARFLSEERNCYVKVVFLSSRSEVPTVWSDLKNVDFVKLNSAREFYGLFKFLIYLLFKEKNIYDFCFTSHVHCNALMSFVKRVKLVKVNDIVMRESTNVFSWFKGYKLKLIKLLYFFYAKDGKIICQTPKMRTELLTNISKLKRGEVVVIPNPVEFQLLQELSTAYHPSLTAKNCLEVSSATNCLGIISIVAVGRLVQEKSFDLILHALSNLPSNFVLYIVGSGPLHKSLLDITFELGLEGRVTFVGSLSNPFPYMRCADVCVVSSSLEGFPNVLLEMMSLSSNVVSTLCADGIDNIPGIITCQVGSHTALKESILKAASLSPSEKLLSIELMRNYVKSLDISKFVSQAFFL